MTQVLAAEKVAKTDIFVLNVAETSYVGLEAKMALDFGGLPQCGINCIVELIASSRCDSSNQTCICDEIDIDLTSANPFLLCVMGHCTVMEGLKIKNFTATTCEHPESPHLNSISIAFLVLFGIQTVFFALRMITRALKITSWGWDDLTIIAAFIATVGVITCRQLQLQAGMGRDIWTLTPEEITNYIKIFYVFGLIYTITLALVKASICFLYLRLFPNPRFQRIVWITQAFNVALMLTFVFVLGFQCTPPSHFWNMWHGEHAGKCLQFSKLSLAQSGLYIALDVWMLALPFWQVLKLNLPIKKTMDAFIMFGCGIFFTIVSILRLQSMVTLVNGQNPTKDLTWLATWSNVEITVGIIIACLPATRLLVLRYLPRKVSAWHHTSHHHISLSNHTPRSSKGGSTATWVSGLSGKRESNPPQPSSSMPLADASPFDKDRECSVQVAVSSPGEFKNTENHAAAAAASSSGGAVSGPHGRRDSELPLGGGGGGGFDAPQPGTAAAGQSSSVPDNTLPNPTPTGKDRRIWVEQHVYVSNDPTEDVTVPISPMSY